MTQTERIAHATMALRLNAIQSYIPLPVKFAMERTVVSENSQADDDLIDAWLEFLAEEAE